MTDEGIDVEVLNRLRAPFPPEAVGKLPRVTCKDCRDRKCATHKPTNCRTCSAYIGRHIHLDYVGHAHVRERLLDVDPGWNWEPLAYDQNGLPAVDGNGGMWIRLTVGGVSRLGYGDAPGKRGGDAVKEVIGDALRNAGQSFGIALDLWKKEPAGVVDDQPARLVERPKLSEDQQRTELRKQIATFGSNNGRSIPEIADDFALWSQGKEEINRANSETLAEYLEHIATEASGGSS